MVTEQAQGKLICQRKAAFQPSFVKLMRPQVTIATLNNCSNQLQDYSKIILKEIFYNAIFFPCSHFWWINSHASIFRLGKRLHCYSYVPKHRQDVFAGWYRRLDRRTTLLPITTILWGPARVRTHTNLALEFGGSAVYPSVHEGADVLPRSSQNAMFHNCALEGWKGRNGKEATFAGAERVRNTSPY